MTGTQLQVVLYDCDDFTRKFYLDYLGLSDIAVLGQVMSVLSVFSDFLCASDGLGPRLFVIGGAQKILGGISEMHFFMCRIFSTTPFWKVLTSSRDVLM